MAGLDIDIKLDTRQVNRAIKRVVKDVKRPQKFLNSVANEQMDEAKKRIRMTKTDPENRAWSPWSYATLKARRADGTAGRGLLYKTGMLLNSFAKKVERKRMAITNRTNYGKWLQFGTQYMKARAFLGWGKQSIKSTSKTGVKFFGRGWK